MNNLLDHKALLRTQDVSKTYIVPGGAVTVLKQVNFTLAPYESVSIRGESGCGKTTLLNVLCGLESIDSGFIYWKGRLLAPMNNSELAQQRSRQLGLIFQAFYLLGELNALENVLLAKRLVSTLTDQDRQHALALLQRVGLQSRTQHMPAQLSGGERQRVAIARALMNNPQIILADEPTGNLDEKTAHQIMALLLELTHEYQASLVLVTHNPDFAQMTTRALTLQNGTLSV